MFERLLTSFTSGGVQVILIFAMWGIYKLLKKLFGKDDK